MQNPVGRCEIGEARPASEQEAEKPVTRARTGGIGRPEGAPGRRGPRVGLLGGSFNPAHEGHLHVSHLALARLRLDMVWWLVAPRNPLKPAADMAPFAERLALARAIAHHPRIRVSTLERDFATLYTVDTLDRLKRRFPRTRFVWLMGADILFELPRWHDWPGLFARVPIAVFDRGPYSCFHRALAGPAARRFRHRLVPAARAAELADMAPPAWTYIRDMRRHPASATALRTGLADRGGDPDRRGP